MCVANGALFIVGGNWSALLWMIFACLCLYIVVLLDTHLGRCHDVIKEQYSYIEDADEHINYLVGLDMFKELKKAECWRANCERALKNMSMLKTLNKGLMRDNQQLRKENSYLKKNTYAKHTYGRTDKNRTTSGIK